MIRDKFSLEIQKYLSEEQWLIAETSYCQDENLNWESRFCLTNGYLGTRGAHAEGTKKSIPCTYINGIFDKSETFMRELANLPNWLGLKIYHEKELLGLENCEILEYIRVLDLRKSLLAKRVILQDRKGRKSLVEELRFVSRSDRHAMGIRLYITPLNYSGILEGENIIDGTVINFADAPRFKVKHTLLTANKEILQNDIYQEVATRDSHLHVGIGCAVTAEESGRNRIRTKMFHSFGEQSIGFFDFEVRCGEQIRVTKYCNIYSEREVRADEICGTVCKGIQAFLSRGFETELASHIETYEEMWKHADISIEGDSEINQAVRFNIYHLMSTGNETDSYVNIGAKLLHGEEYGGHAFWDTELFMMPFFAYVFPKTARNLELYRYHLLEAARNNARKNGYQGAQYPWESADDGTEQCPDWTIEPDGTCYRCYVAVYEHHVTAAVAYGVYHYVKISGDEGFMLGEGAEILCETARFWASRCEYNGDKDRYEIRQVTGPDEWHEPVNNNLYTNYLAKWNLKYVQEILRNMKANHREQYELLKEKISLKEEELSQWEKVQSKIYLPNQDHGRLLEQFEGYFDLQEVLIEKFDENDWPLRPEILKKVKTEDTQVIKQADVVMLLNLMGHMFDAETIKENYYYYEKRTLHGSSLSPSIYAIMGLKVGDSRKAYQYLKRSATLDLLDLQKNTREGIHAANAGGVWQTVIFGFGGLDIDNDGILSIQPHLPEKWTELKFQVYYRNARIEITIQKERQISVRLVEGDSLKVRFGNCVHNILPGEKTE